MRAKDVEPAHEEDRQSDHVYPMHDANRQPVAVVQISGPLGLRGGGFLLHANSPWADRPALRQISVARRRRFRHRRRNRSRQRLKWTGPLTNALSRAKKRSLRSISRRLTAERVRRSVADDVGFGFNDAPGGPPV